ncbi:MAG: S-layer homology domain-containing protein [Fimbriimonadales bacterium]
MRSILALLTILACHLALAQASGQPTPKSDRIVRDMIRLHLYLAPDRRVGSKYEYAVAAHQSYIWLKDLLRHLETGRGNAGDEFYRSFDSSERYLSRAAIETLQLLGDFSAEYDKLGGDSRAAKADLATFAVRFQTVVSKRLMSVSCDGPVPYGSSEQKTVGRLYADALLPVDWYWHRRTPRRSEIAAATRIAVSNLKSGLVEIQSEMSRIALAGPVAKELRRGWSLLFPQFKSDFAVLSTDLPRLIYEFYGELVAQGADPDEMIATVEQQCEIIDNLRLPHVGERIGPFSDVPASHWAAGATNELKGAGILVGDGSGHFGG